MFFADHYELVELGCELLKSEGYKTIKKEFPDFKKPKEKEIAQKNNNYSYDICAVKKKEIVAVVECGRVPAEKMDFLIKKFGDKFYWIPLSAEQFMYFAEKSKEKRTDEISGLDKEIKKRKKEIEELNQNYSREHDKRQKILDAMKQTIQTIDHHLKVISMEFGERKWRNC